VDTVELPIQLNGKVRARMEIAADADPAQVEEMALKVVKDMMEGKTLRKAIIIPGRMVNLVVG
jgi:leucyl-tRNA synthetase